MYFLVLVVFLLLCLLGVPIGYVMGISSFVGLIIVGGTGFLRIAVTGFHGAVNNFLIIAIPFFILTAEFMNRAGITNLIIDFVNSILGHFRGGLSHVNVGVCTIFGSLTGSAITVALGAGSALIPAMKKQGYPAAYCAAAVGAAACLGPIIPPSIVAVIYSSIILETSVRSLFAAGVIPGLLLSTFLLIVSVITSYRRHFPQKKKASFKEILNSTKNAILPLLLPFIILGPIFLGMTTITEAAAMGALYALILGVFVYKTLKLKDIIESAFTAVKFCGMVFLLLCTANALGWFISRSGISLNVSTFLASNLKSPNMIVFVITIFLLIVGSFVDTFPAVIVLAPIIAPALMKMGFHPIHVGMIMLVNLNIGNATPPMGMALMSTAKIAKVSYESAIKEITPFIIIMIIVCFLVAYFPIISLWLPQLLGFI